MFQLISKETDLATTILEFARLQRSYHQAALATLDEMIPELESNICKSNALIPTNNFLKGDILKYVVKCFLSDVNTQILK